MSIRRSPLPNWGEGQSEGNIAAVLRNLTKHLTNYSDAPDLDADRIILHALKQREPSYLIAHGSDILSPDELNSITAMAEQRKTGMPLAYILGEADFYGRTFLVTPDVLIPRPDTEALLEKALEYIKNNLTEKTELIIADICTGSGIIAITLALEIHSKFPIIRLKIIATDISKPALEIAKQNAEKHGVAEKIEFITGDMLEPINNRHVDLIVSNPPYVPTAELEQLSLRGAKGDEAISEYETTGLLRSARNDYALLTRGLKFEPRIALDGGPDGQKFVNQIKASKIPAIIEATGGEIIFAAINHSS